MELVTLENTGMSPPGFVQFRLGIGAVKRLQMPGDETLQKLFKEHVRPQGGLQVTRRAVNHCVVLMPTGTKLANRNSFVRAVNEAIAQAESAV